MGRQTGKTMAKTNTPNFRRALSLLINSGFSRIIDVLIFHSAMPIRLIVGLGNPGPEYEQTRHNAGFWLVDNLSISIARCRLVRETRFNALAAKARIGAQEVWLLEPQTYMNRSGQAVGALARFYKIGAEIGR